MILAKKFLWIKCRNAKFTDQEGEEKCKNIKNTTKKALKNAIVKYENEIPKKWVMYC